MQVRAFRTRGEERCIVTGEFVADIHHQIARRTGGSNNSRCIVGGGVNAAQWPLTSREVVILNIDYDKRLFGHGMFLNGVACVPWGEVLALQRWLRIGWNDNIEG